MNSSNSRRVVNMAIFGLVGVGLIGITSPANAAAPVTGTATQQCLVKPAWWNTTTEAAQSHVEQRWYRDLLGQEKITYDAHKFGYSFAEQKEESHAEWKYSNFVKGLEEIAHYLHQFERTNPGQAEVSHYLHQFERINPGQEATSSLSYQFSRTNPGQAEKSHQEYKYTKQAPAVLETKYKKSVVKTEFEYKKYVKGVVQVKQGHQWVSAGSTFTWEIWPNYPAKWDVSNKDVIETILQLMGHPADHYEHVVDRAGHDLRYAIDSSKLRSELGWLPEHTHFESGLRQTIDWYRTHEDWWRPRKAEVEEKYRRGGQ